MNKMSHAAPTPYNERPYRPCVGIFLLNNERKVFAGRRIDSRAEAWQMPQGGIDAGESPLDACMREMHEEIGTNAAEFVEHALRNFVSTLILGDLFTHKEHIRVTFHFVAHCNT